MSLLKLVQTTADGRTKCWKLSAGTELFTFGTSRKAKIISIDNDLENFESVFEFKNSKWHYINFSTKTKSADTPIEDKSVIKLSNSTLKFNIINKDLDLKKNIESFQSDGTQTKQLVLVTKNNKILNLHIKEASELFDIYSEGVHQKLKLPLTESWSTQELSECTLQYKKINTPNLSSYEIQKNSQIIEKEDKFAVLSVLGLTVLLIVGSFFVTNRHDLPPVVTAHSSPTLIAISNLKKKLKKEAQSPAAPKQAIIQKNNLGAASSGKVSALLKGALGVRISQLIGKVSATEARTANVLVTTSGVKAGEGKSGRALAAIGKAESSGRNWTGESTGTGRGISTAGIGGGNNSTGLNAGLGQGKTGTGGVGLIEDESEITGGLDREIIAQYIKTQLGQILYCYERQLSASPNLYGKIAVKFTIAGTGQVETQSINDTTLKNSSVESCILSKISKWRFPEPKGGTKVLVTYPFLFKSTI